jgi:hypothetical protein
MEEAFMDLFSDKNLEVASVKNRDDPDAVKL